MNASASRPLRTLFAVLRGGERATWGAAASAQALERLAVVGAAASVAVQASRGAWVVAAALGVTFLARAGFVAVLRMRVRVRLMEALAASLLAEAGDVTTSATEDLEVRLIDGLFAAEEILGQRLPELAGDLAASIVLAAVILVSVPGRLVFEGGAAIAVGAIVAMFARRVTAASSERTWRALVPALEDLSTAIHARLEIVGNGDADAFVRRLSAKLVGWRLQALAAGRLSFLAGRAPVVGAAVVVGLLLLADDGWTKGALKEVAILASATPAFAGLARGAMDLTRSLVRARPTIDCIARGRVALPGGAVSPPPVSSVSCSALAFTYAGSTHPALAGVDVVWKRGELLGLAGANGSGKSTFLRLLLGLSLPSAGTVKVGGVPLADLDRVALRRSIGYLAQRPFVPDRMTVLEAVRLLAPDATPSSAEAALTRLALWPVLVGRSPGAPLDVKVGTLSAGEKQRVAIARVLLRDAPLLILDEPDANLDASGVARVAEVLRSESEARMVVFAAHDPALLAAAGRLLRFEGGKVTEGGSLTGP